MKFEFLVNSNIHYRDMNFFVCHIVVISQLAICISLIYLYIKVQPMLDDVKCYIHIHIDHL